MGKVCTKDSDSRGPAAGIESLSSNHDNTKEQQQQQHHQSPQVANPERTTPATPRHIGTTSAKRQPANEEDTASPVQPTAAKTGHERGFFPSRPSNASSWFQSPLCSKLLSPPAPPPDQEFVSASEDNSTGAAGGVYRNGTTAGSSLIDFLASHHKRLDFFLRIPVCLENNDAQDEHLYGDSQYHRTMPPHRFENCPTKDSAIKRSFTFHVTLSDFTVRNLDQYENRRSAAHERRHLLGGGGAAAEMASHQSTRRQLQRSSYRAYARFTSAASSQPGAHYLLIISWDGDYMLRRTIPRQCNGRDTVAFEGCNLSFVWSQIEDLRLLQSRYLEMGLFAVCNWKTVEFIGHLKISAMSIATGPIHHDFSLIKPDVFSPENRGGGTADFKKNYYPPRVQFNCRMSQLCHLRVTPAEILVDMGGQSHPSPPGSSTFTRYSCGNSQHAGQIASAPRKGTEGSHLDVNKTNLLLRNNTSTEIQRSRSMSVLEYNSHDIVDALQVTAVEDGTFSGPVCAEGTEDLNLCRDSNDPELDQQSLELAKQALGGHTGDDERKPVVADWQVDFRATGVHTSEEYVATTWDRMTCLPHWAVLEDVVDDSGSKPEVDSPENDSEIRMGGSLLPQVSQPNNLETTEKPGLVLTRLADHLQPMSDLLGRAYQTPPDGRYSLDMSATARNSCWDENQSGANPGFLSAVDGRRNWTQIASQDKYRTAAQQCINGTEFASLLSNTTPPTLHLYATSDSIRQYYVHLRLWTKPPASKEPKIFGESWVPFFRLFETDVVSYYSRFFYDAQFSETLWSEGRAVGRIHGLIVFQDCPLLRQMITGIHTENGYSRSITPLIGISSRGREKYCPTEILELQRYHLQLQKVMFAGSSSPFDPAAIVEKRESSLTNLESICDRLEELLGQSGTASNSRPTFAYSDIRALISGQKTFIAILIIIIDSLDTVPWNIRGKFGALIGIILRRGELEIGNLLATAPTRSRSFAAHGLDMRQCIRKVNAYYRKAQLTTKQTCSKSEYPDIEKERNVRGTNGGGGHTQDPVPRSERGYWMSMVARLGRRKSKLEEDDGNEKETTDIRGDDGDYGDVLSSGLNLGSENSTDDYGSDVETTLSASGMNRNHPAEGDLILQQDSLCITSDEPGVVEPELGEAGLGEPEIAESGVVSTVPAPVIEITRSSSGEKREAQHQDNDEFFANLTNEELEEIHIYHNRQRVARTYIETIFKLLEYSLIKIQADALFESQRRQICSYLSICFRRLPQFRHELLSKVLDPAERTTGLSGWKATDFNLDDTALYELGKWSPKSFPGIYELQLVLDWDPLDVALRTYFGDAVIDDMHNRVCQRSIGWEKNFLSPRTVTFFSFFEVWVRSIWTALNHHWGHESRDATIARSPYTVRWDLLPGYATLVKAFLIEMNTKPITKYPDAMLNCSAAMLVNSKLLSAFIRIVLSRTNLIDREQVFASFNYIDFWLEVFVIKKASLPMTLDHKFLTRAMEIIIFSDLAYQTAKVLWFVYKKLDILSSNVNFLRNFIELFLHRGFHILLFSWSWLVRRCFINLLLYKICERARRIVLAQENLSKDNTSDVPYVHSMEDRMFAWAYLQFARYAEKFGFPPVFPTKFVDESIRRVVAQPGPNPLVVGPSSTRVPSPVPLSSRDASAGGSSKQEINTMSRFLPTHLISRRKKVKPKKPPKEHTADLEGTPPAEIEDLAGPLLHYFTQLSPRVDLPAQFHPYVKHALAAYTSELSEYKLWILSGADEVPPMQIPISPLDTNVDVPLED